MDQRYVVQFVLVREVEVTAGDELQAEREGYKKLAERDKNNAVAIYVLKEKDNGGALGSDDLSENWKFARENFYTMDEEWVTD